ncbi:MAG TPA: polysaccharide deacetylase family protein [Nitrososphaerales archaeon]|nr:polysaccharide deacetylase family protein [Nitrososphaerales archaeon]
MRRRGSIRRPMVALTFDDGYLEHFLTAKTLSHLGVPATFFLITGLEVWNGRRLLFCRPDLVREICEMGHEIGSHSLSHPDMTALGSDRVAVELSESRGRLEEVTGKEVQGFAYPYGRFNPDVKLEASRTYRYARAALPTVRGSRDAYSIGVKHPGRNIAFSSLLEPVDMLSGDWEVLLFHSVPNRSLMLWVPYLRSIGAGFVTMNELAEEQMKPGRAG